jgi:hypothetical protein
MTPEQIDFLKKFTNQSSGETVYDDFVKKITDVVETTKELTPKKMSFYDIVANRFRGSTNTDKSKVEGVISVITDLQLESYNHVNDHKRILSEVKNHIDTNEKTIEMFSNRIEEIAQEKALLLPESKEYLDLTFEEKDVQSNLLTCNIFKNNLTMCQEITSKVYDNFVSIRNTTIPSIMNTLLTLVISNKNRKAIEFSQSINALNNQSMVKMSGNLKELTMDINNLMETTPISVETINSVIKNIEDTAIETARHKKEILDKLNANIAQTKEAISKLTKGD